MGRDDRQINREVADHYRKYDLRHTLATRWAMFAPKLEGKLHIWVGEADDYYLNNAVHLLEDFLSHSPEPKLQRRVTFGRDGKATLGAG